MGGKECDVKSQTFFENEINKVFIEVLNLISTHIVSPVLNMTTTALKNMGIGKSRSFISVYNLFDQGNVTILIC